MGRRVAAATMFPLRRQLWLQVVVQETKEIPRAGAAAAARPAHNRRGASRPSPRRLNVRALHHRVHRRKRGAADRRPHRDALSPGLGLAHRGLWRKGCALLERGLRVYIRAGRGRRLALPARLTGRAS